MIRIIPYIRRCLIPAFAVSLLITAGVVFAQTPPIASLSKPAFVNVHGLRAEIWRTQNILTVENLKNAKAAAIDLEKGSRQKVVEYVNQRLRDKGLNKAVPSGTPPHSPGSSGILTDIDDTYATLADSKAAAKEFQDMGYTVEWNTDTDFSVKELDYTGFSEETITYKPGSAEEKRALERAARFEDKVGSVGGQEWIEGVVKPGGKLDNLKSERVALAEALDDVDLPDDLRQRKLARIAELEDEVALVTRKIEAAVVNDMHGFNTDMMKKGLHHMDPANWCPPQVRFKCMEEPRQAAKAAHRILSNTVKNPTAEQVARMDELKAIAKGKKILPTDPEAFRKAAQKLQQDIRNSFREANQFAQVRENAYRKGLLAQHEAALKAGDKKALAKVAEELAEQREAAKRIRVTLQQVLDDPNMPHARQTAHEWMTGEKVRKVEVPGEAAIYEVIEETADGPKVLRRLSETELKKTTNDLIRKNQIREIDKGLPGRPRLSSFAQADDVNILSRSARRVKGTIAELGTLGMLQVGYASYLGAEGAVEVMNEAGEYQIPGTDDFLNMDVSREEWVGLGNAIAVGTVIAIGEATGVAQVVRDVAAEDTTGGQAVVGLKGGCYLMLSCFGYDAGKALFDAAAKQEIEDAQRQGRAANQLGVLANVINQRGVARLGTDVGTAVGGWLKNRLSQMGGFVGAEIENLQAQFRADQAENKVMLRLMYGGYDQLITNIAELRVTTQILKDAWRRGTDNMDKAIRGRDDLAVYASLLESSKLGDRCIEAGEAGDKMRAVWEKELADYAATLNKALLAAYQVLGRAQTTSSVFADAAGLGQLITRQSGIQQSLSRRFERLALATDNDPQIITLQAEVTAQVDPVDPSLMAEFTRTAVEISTEVQDIIKQLEALGQQKIPECEPDDEEEKDDEEETEADDPTSGDLEEDTDDKDDTENREQNDPSESEDDLIPVSGAPLVLRLVKVSEPVLSEGTKKADCKLTRFGSGAGAVKKCGVAPNGGYAVSAGLTRFPTEIIVGQPFEVEFFAKWASAFPNYRPCEEREFKDDDERARCFSLGVMLKASRHTVDISRIFPKPNSDFQARIKVRFIPVKCTATGFYGKSCDDPEVRALQESGKHVPLRYSYQVESSLPLNKNDENEFYLFHSESLPVNEDGFVILETTESQSKKGRERVARTAEELKRFESLYGFQLRLRAGVDELATAYYMPVPVGGEYLASATAHSHPGKLAAPKAVPKYLIVIMEVKGSGYHLYTDPPGGKTVWGKRISGWDRRVLRVKWGQDPANIAQELYDKLSSHPDCLKSGLSVMIEGRPKIWDSGPQVKILNVGPFLNSGEVSDAKEAGEFDLGSEWNYEGEGEKLWGDGRCEK